MKIKFELDVEARELTARIPDGLASDGQAAAVEILRHLAGMMHPHVATLVFLRPPAVAAAPANPAPSYSESV